MTDLLEMSQQVGDRTLLVRCSPALRTQGEWLLRAFQDMNANGVALADGTRIEIGWSVLELHDTGAALVACEPDFIGDPIADVVDHVNYTLIFQAEQNDVLRDVGLPAVATRFDQTVVVARAALDEPRLVLERGEPGPANLCGWSVGSRDRPGGDSVTMPVYELLRVRPGAMKVLALPPGSHVVLDGEELISVRDRERRVVWLAPGEPPG